MTQMQEVIETELEPRTAEELAGAYRAICGMMLVHTAMSTRRTVACSEDARQKKAARQWIRGGGVLPYAECCEALGLCQRRAAECIRVFAESRRLPSINTVPDEET
jgi:hypothetical protein